MIETTTSMRLWIIRPINAGVSANGTTCHGSFEDDSPWGAWPDCVFGFVVSATSEDEARSLTAGAVGDERVYIPETRPAEYRNPWTDPSLSTCVELKPDDTARIIMREVHYG